MSTVRDTVERMYDQIRNIFKTLASVVLPQAHPNNVANIDITILLQQLHYCNYCIALIDFVILLISFTV